MDRFRCGKVFAAGVDTGKHVGQQIGTPMDITERINSDSSRDSRLWAHGSTCGIEDHVAT